MKIGIIRNAKISIKLTIIYAFMFSFILLILNAAVLFGVKNYLYTESYKQVNDTKSILLNNINGKVETVDVKDEKLLLAIPNKENLYVKIIDNNDNVLNISDKFNYKIKVKDNYNEISKIEEKERHLLFENIQVDTSKYGKVTIEIVKDMDREYDFMKILFLLMAISDFAGIVLSIGIGYFISKRLLKPIAQITKTADNISFNNLKERIEIHGPDDELKRLSNTLNNMIDRLQDSFERQTQFVADASHELRTPIAVISGYANLLDRWGKDDRSALEKSIYAIKLESSSMAKMIEDLLFLAKGDSGNNNLEKTKFLFNDLVEEIIEESKLIDASHTITSNKNCIVEFYADRKMIKQALRVFLDNSIKFTPSSGKITINSEIEESNLKISIIDTGIGIPKENLKQIFDRFYTVDKSRSKENGGTGLGLSIAKWIVEKHGGIIQVLSEEGRGTSIIIKFHVEI